MEFKVLGTGSANCKATTALIEQMAQARGVPSREKMQTRLVA